MDEVTQEPAQVQFIVGRLGRTPQEAASGAEQYREYWGGTEWIHARDRAQVFNIGSCDLNAMLAVVLNVEPDEHQRIVHGVFVESERLDGIVPIGSLVTGNNNA